MLVCKYERTIFSSPKNGYMVARYRADSKETTNGQPVGQFTAVGYNLPETNAIKVDLIGEWAEGKYGPQFSVENYTEIVPQTVAGIEAYLCSGLIRGIGKKLGKVIVAEFGIDTLNILDKKPEKLMKISGVGKTRYKTIVESYTASRAARSIVTFLTQFGITANKAVKIYQAVGQNALERVKNNPYSLSRYSIGFKTCDKIGRSIGFDPHSQKRIEYGILYTLNEIMNIRGHLFVHKDPLLIQTRKLLNTETDTIKIDELDMMLNTLATTKDVYIFNDIVYTKQSFDAEHGIAIDVVRLMHAKLNIKTSNDYTGEISKTEKILNIHYSDEQVEAILASLQNSLNIIVGYPGTGKTTVIKGIIDIIQRLNKNVVITLCSPTGRAARRMSEATGYPAATIHKVLGLTSDEYSNNGCMLDNSNVIIVDELSMLDAFLAETLFHAIVSGTKVLLVGDPDQLPSVGPGAVLYELLRSKCIPYTVLKTIFRQAEQGRIVINSKQIREGIPALKFGDDFKFIKAENCEDAAKIITDLYKQEIAGCGMDDCQVLTPLKHKTAACTDMINAAIQQEVNPPSGSKSEITSLHHIFREGDKVINLKNKNMDDIEVSNGDIGVIERIFSSENCKTLVVNFGDGRHVEYTSDNFDMLDLAYAITIHKSQGSEYKSVILNLMGAPDIMLKRNLVYTAVTRAKVKLTIIGTLWKLSQAIKTLDTSKRNTLLADRIVSIVKRIKKRKAVNQAA